mgnify:CR=1 FL=1
MDDFYFEDEDTRSEGGLDLRRYWVALLKRWWLWTAITVAVAVPWVMFVKKEKPVYETRATLQFISVGGNDDLLATARQEKLLSRSFSAQVVAKLGLAMDFLPLENDSLLQRREIFKSFSTTQSPQTGLYLLRFPGDGTFSLSILDQEDETFESQVLSSRLLDAQIGPLEYGGMKFQLAENESFPAELRFSVRNFQKAVTGFIGQIDVRFNRGSTLMFITLRNSDPFLAMQTTNLLAEIFKEESIQIKDAGVQQQYSTLKRNLEQAQAKLDSSTANLISFQRRNPTVGSTESQAGRISQRLTDAEREHKDLRRAVDAIKGLLSEMDKVDDFEQKHSYLMTLVELPTLRDHPRLVVERSNMERLKGEYDRIVSASSELNDEAISFQKEISRVHQSIRTIARNELNVFEKEIKSVEGRISESKLTLRSMPAKENEYQILLGQKRNDEDLVKDLNERLSKLDITKDDVDQVDILDAAILPEHPTNGNKPMKAAAGAAGGFFLGIFVTLFLEFFDKTMKTVEDVKRYMRVNVLGAIPQVNFDDIGEYQDHEKIKLIDNQLVTHDYAPTPIGEAYRSLRTSILFSKEIGRVQSLVITSMAPGDGKSFTSSNLAITMAQQKTNTLLVDTDLRRGVQHNTFGVPKEPGFSNYLTSTLPLPEIVRETQIPNLSVVSCGSLIPNPSELLGSHQMQRFLDEVRRRFDLVIFDTPPLNAATDAVVVGTQVDGTIIVVRAGKTHREIAKQKMELYQHVPAKVMGIILNGASADLAHEGYSYYHY